MLSSPPDEEPEEARAPLLFTPASGGVVARLPLEATADLAAAFLLEVLAVVEEEEADPERFLGILPGLEKKSTHSCLAD